MKEQLAIFGLSIGFFAIIILPYLVFGFYFSPWYISIPDIIDIVFYGLVIGLSFYLLFEEKLSHAPSWIKYLFIYLFILHFTGHGFHWAANAMNESIINAGSGTPQYVSEYAYFLDEVLSHYIMYPTFLAMLLLLLVADMFYLQKEKEEYSNAMKLMSIPSIIFGFSYMISSAESQLPYLTIAMAVAYICMIGWILKVKGYDELNKRPYQAFIFETSIVILIVAIIYWILFPGFPEPSKIL